jgi:hypothetical protein
MEDVGIAHRAVLRGVASAVAVSLIIPHGAIARAPAAEVLTNPKPGCITVAQKADSDEVAAMGAWGPAIFADDDAADLRADYRAYLADAQSDAGATDLAARNYDASLERPGETTAFWLALASIQWRMGRLDPRVKAAALAIIDNGIDLEKWAGSPDRGKRAAVLAKLRKMISSQLPRAKPVPKPLPVQLPGWEFGEVVGYPMANGKYALLHALNYRGWSTDAVRAPVVSILGWFSEALPDPESIDRLTYINHDGHRIGGHHLVCLAMPRAKALAAAQFDRPGWSKPVTRGEANSAVYGLGGHEGGDIEKTLKRVLSPYWEDATRPVHVPKEFAPDVVPEEQARLYAEWSRRLFGTA